MRRAGPLGVALTAYDIWRRIPRQHRKAILKQARKHGPLIAQQARKHGPLIAEQARKHGPAVAKIVQQNRKRRR